MTYIPGSSSGGYQEFTSTNPAWTVPTGVTSIRITAVGAGGGGGGGGTPGYGGAGGGGGALVWRQFATVNPAETLSITIGAGGSGGAATTDGTSGGSTYVSRSPAGTVICLANGGGGGAYGIQTQRAGKSADGFGGGGGSNGNFLAPVYPYLALSESPSIGKGGSNGGYNTVYSPAPATYFNGVNLAGSSLGSPQGRFVASLISLQDGTVIPGGGGGCGLSPGSPSYSQPCPVTPGGSTLTSAGGGGGTGGSGYGAGGSGGASGSGTPVVYVSTNGGGGGAGHLQGPSGGNSVPNGYTGGTGAAGFVRIEW